MPLYEYYCADCHGVFELLRPARESSDPQACPECDEDSRRIVSNFEAFTVRDGAPRRLPDDGTYWHLGEKVGSPINGPTIPGEHPELSRKRRGPQKPPTVEELERHEFTKAGLRERAQIQRDSGRTPVADSEVEKRSRRFEQRTRRTAARANLSRRRKPNVETTARTASGKHEPTRKKQ